jgi:ABC-2 type transport system ATP-binding protein
MKLRLNHIKKSFGEKEVLKDVTFTFEEGRIYGLLGRNGAGKTTLFNCINEDLPLESGSFAIEEDGAERNVTSDDIGYVLSTPVVPEFLTGREFLKFFMEIHPERAKDGRTPDEYFDFMKMTPEDRDRLMKDYSHGMKNKMQMLVQFIANPAILLLDEPLTSFDVVVAEEMKQMFRSIKKDHILIFSTHIMELALDLCDEIVILNGGVLEEIGRESLTNEEMKARIIQALTEEEHDSDL